MSDPDGEPTVTLVNPTGSRTLVTAQRIGTREDGPEAVVQWVLPAADPNAEPMPIPDACPSPASRGP
jgi:hypothetical protein